MLTLYIFFALLYGGLLFYLRQIWWHKIPEVDLESPSIPVTLILPIRNEAHHLPLLFQEIESLVYPDLEVILVDDHSEDGGAALIQSRENEALKVPIQYLLNEGTGKKQALETGIFKAKGEVIVQSDADCRWPDHWISGLLAGFGECKTMMVAGPVMSLPKPGFFATFQQIEWGSILLLSHFFFYKKSPLMCSGANLAYRKAAFLKVGGFEGNREWLSGDDAFLLTKIAATFGPESIIYQTSKSQLVHTEPSPDWGAYLSQRIRWAGKWRHPENKSKAWAAMGTFGIQIVFLSSFALPFFGKAAAMVFIFLWGIKCLAEKQVLGLVLEDMGFKFKLLDYLKASFLHPIYAIRVGLSTLGKEVEWKGRKGHTTNIKYPKENV
ncbi:glycosyltransferase [Pararhodonellum marinum]|uniref:glycosyltransferase n=1 Tax=Pararhodonellum marinum TaxID=2755358 RepID=UPI00188ED7D6|nr:glycosyltransferase [Pararhodonellum marinum]